MAKPVSIPNVFQTQPGPLPLSNLDADFSTLATAMNDLGTYSNYFADSGAVNTMVVTAAGLTWNNTDGYMLQVQVGNTTTSATVTLNVNAAGALNVVNSDGSALQIGQLRAGMRIIVICTGAVFQLLSGQSASLYGIVTAGGFNANGSTVPANGMYLPSANTLGFSTNSISRLTIGSSGVINTTTDLGVGGTLTVSGGTVLADFTNPRYRFRDGSQGADGKFTEIVGSGATINFAFLNDALSISRNFLQASRSGVAVTNVSFGNATDNNSYTFLGTGTVTFQGMVSQISSVAAAGLNLVVQNTSNNANSFSSVRARADNSFEGIFAISSSAASAAFFTGGPAVQALLFGTSNNIPISVATSGVERIRIDGAGASINLLATNLIASGSWNLNGIITPAALGADQNNYSPAGLASASVIRQDVTGATRTITGLDATNATNGKVILIVNLSATQTLVIAPQNASSTAANRFININSVNTVLAPDGAVPYWYDATSQRWRQMASYT